MPRRTLPYREGDWFAVPLGCGGYALGLAARVSNSGAVLAYFFQPRYEGIPTIEEIGKRDAEDAIVVAQVGGLGLIKGTWKVVAPLEPWTPSKWPLPAFGRYDLTGEAWRVYYSEGLDKTPREEPASIEEVRNLPRDGLWGYMYAEERLSKLLCESETEVASIASPTDFAGESPRASPHTSIEGAPTSDGQQAVLVWVKLSNEQFGTPEERQRMFDLEDELMAAVEQSSAGEYDGHEFGEGWCTIYIYGPSAERLHRAIASILAKTALPPGSYVVKRYGGPGAREEQLRL